MVTSPNWIAPFHIARATVAPHAAAARAGVPGRRASGGHDSARPQGTAPATAALKVSVACHLTTMIPSRLTVGRPAVALTRSTTVCVPLDDHVFHQATRRAWVDL